jgi:hypothetical protein
MASPVFCWREVASVMMAAAIAASQSTGAFQARNEPAVDRFNQSIREYVQMRERIEKTMPPLEVSSDWRRIETAVDARAAAIQKARPYAKPGDVFGENADAALGGTIVKALTDRGYDIAALLADKDEDEEVPAGTPRPRVNMPYPAAWGRWVYPAILGALPVLPEPLEYRLVGRDLVLVDADANLVIDILENALAAPTRSPGGTS